MANDLTGLLPTIYNAMYRVSNEPAGMIGAVSRDATANQAAKDQVVRSPVVPAMVPKAITPKNIADSGTDRNVGYVDIVIDNLDFVDFNLTGEEERGLGENSATVAQQSFEEAFRALRNKIEATLTAQYIHASRAAGTAGANPFGVADDFTSLTAALEILDENGAPATDRHAVIGSREVGVLLGKQPALFRINEAGGSGERRQGSLLPMFGAQLHHSGQIKSHVKGGMAGFDVNEAGHYAVGATTIAFDGGTVNSTGAKAGDVVTIGTDPNKYVIGTGSTSTSGTIVLNQPGLRAIAAHEAEMAIGNSYRANMVFSRDAIQLACRVPAVPTGGDQASDRTYVTDPFSGLTFEVSVYRQMRQVTYFVGICWGVKVIKSDHLALMLG